MISGLRHEVLDLACRRYGFVAGQGRGLHLLPAEVTDQVERTLVQSVQADHLNHALSALVELRLFEVSHLDQGVLHRHRFLRS